MNFPNDPIYRTSERKLIVQDVRNQFSKILSVIYSHDHNEVFDNEYDLWLFSKNKMPVIIYSAFDEDVYNYLEKLLTGSNSLTILEELKRKGVI